jgi:putative glycosyltransferase (TIGR04348 family)
MSLTTPIVRIATPYAASANNGNWRTAARWVRLLRDHFRVIVQGPDDTDDTGRAMATRECLIALHARRSHTVIRSWREARPADPLIVVLTGTDLYRDFPDSAEARDSLRIADRLIVLQENAVEYLPPEHRSKARVVYQSSRSLLPAAKSDGRLNCVLVAHLRPEKDPLTAIAAWRYLPQRAAVFLNIVRDGLDPVLARSVREAVAQDRRIHWLGALAHPRTRQLIKRAHLLLVPSLMEGGANVIAEAVTAGTPVLASRISGNVGMLGSAYPGYFPAVDAQALAALLKRCTEEARFYAALGRHCRARRSQFSPQRERSSLLALLGELL